MFRMKHSYLLILVATALLVGWTAPAAAGEFMADFRQYSSWEAEDSRQQSGRLFFKDGASRMEFVRDGQVAEIMIVNPKQKKAWVLNAEDKTFMEIRFADKPWQNTAAGANREGMTEKKLGKETVAGYLCEKTGYSFKDEPGAQTTVWMSPKLGYPVKWEQKNAEGNSSFQLSKIKEGTLKDSLFVLPKGYRNVADEKEEADADTNKEESEAAKAPKKTP
jgi:outer membrane lipoprotein-sorting protein